MHQDSRPPPEERFHHNIIELGQVIHDLVEKVNSKGHKIINPEVVNFAVCILSKLNHVSVIDTFIRKSSYDEEGNPVPFKEHCWTKIRARDRKFFLENAGEIFSNLPSNRVDAFGRMFSLKDEDDNPVVPKEDEDEIWEYFESLVRISIKYVHQKRKPKLIRRGTEEIRRYEVSTFFSDINIAHHAENWSIELHYTQE